MNVYLVGHNGPEHNMVLSVHHTRKGALKAWNRLRLELIGRARELQEQALFGQEMYDEILWKLSCEDPEKSDNYPHDTPYIQKKRVRK